MKYGLAPLLYGLAEKGTSRKPVPSRLWCVYTKKTV